MFTRMVRHDLDAGITLPLVMMVAVIGIAAMMALTSSLLFTAKFTGQGRKVAQAVTTSESGVDSALGYLEATSTTPWSCGPVSGSLPSTSGPVSFSYSIAYYASQDATGSPLGPCPMNGSYTGATVPGSAIVTSIGTSGGRSVTMQAGVQLVQVTSGGTGPTFNEALYGDLGITTNTTMTVKADTGTNAPIPDIYTNKSLQCSTAMDIAGSVYAQDTVTLQSATCKVAKDIYVKNKITIPNGGTPIGGNITVSRWVTSGGKNYSMAINGLPSIGGNVKLGGLAGATTDWWTNQLRTALGSRLQESVANLPDPPGSTFPQLTDTAWPGFLGPLPWGTWLNAQVAPNSARNVCSTTNGFQTPALGNVNTLITMTIPSNSNTIVDARTVCPSLTLGTSTGMKLVLNSDMVLLVDYVQFNSGAFTVVSGDGNAHTLYIVQPSSANRVCTTGTTTTPASGGIEFTGVNWSQGANTKVLFYAPGKVTMRAGLVMRGQIYGCLLDFPTSPLTLTYAPVGQIGGTPTTSVSSGSGSAKLLWKHET